MSKLLTSSRVLITGGTGSFGKTMLLDLLKKGVEEVRVLSRDEEKQGALRTDLNDDRVKFFIGSVRDRESVDRAVKGVDAIFHAAALKQVPSCEFFPIEAVKTNVLGSENVIRSAIEHEIANLVCLSTDKAAMPINAMGISKAMMEKAAQAAAREVGASGKTIIACVRYGNVMYSRGSVIPLFIKQIKSKRPITVTEPTMTRFLMPLRDSVSLVNFALTNSRQGDLFIKKADAATIESLIHALKEIFEAPDHPVHSIGWRHAEKLHETLATAQEISTAEDMGDYWRLQLDDRDLNYKSYFEEGKEKASAIEEYNSSNANRLEVDGVKELLLSLQEVRNELNGWISK